MPPQPSQSDWLRHHVRPAHASGTARVLVVTEPDRVEVVAYYAGRWRVWRSVTHPSAAAPVDTHSRSIPTAGRYPQPVALLARLGVALEHEGRGLGAGLPADVVARTAQLGTGIGCRGLIVHAETAEAGDFYQHLIPEFEPSPTDEQHLVLLMEDIHKTLGM